MNKNSPVGFDPTTHSFTGISMGDAYALKTAYPNVYLDAEVKRAAMWLASRPGDVPAKGQCARFLVQWLARAQADLERPSRAATGVPGGKVVQLFAKRERVTA
jgi:hypothetical protein